MLRRQFFSSFDEYELEQMSRYLSLVSQAIENEKMEFEIFVENKITAYSEEEKEDFLNFHEDVHFEVTEQFPRLLFSSFLVSWYSYIETQFIQLCRRNKFEITVHFEESIKLSNGIDKAKLFLRKSAGYNIEPTHWQELNHIRKIRNYIVHNEGRLPVSFSETNKSIPWEFEGETIYYLLLNKNLYDYLREHELIVHHGVPFVIPNQLFCDHLIGFGKDLVRKVYTDIDTIKMKKYSNKIKN